MAQQKLHKTEQPRTFDWMDFLDRMTLFYGFVLVIVGFMLFFTGLHDADAAFNYKVLLYKLRAEYPNSTILNITTDTGSNFTPQTLDYDYILGINYERISLVFILVGGVLFGEGYVKYFNNREFVWVKRKKKKPVDQEQASQ